MKMWCVQAQVVTVKNGWSNSRQVPTFYLHPDVQGIVDQAHAERIARGMFEGAGEVYLSAYLVDVEAD